MQFGHLWMQFLVTAMFFEAAEVPSWDFCIYFAKSVIGERSLLSGPPLDIGL